MARRRALVTGSGGGIGAAAAGEFAWRGYDVVLNEPAPSLELDELAAQLRTWGVDVDAVLADVRTADGVDRLGQSAGDRLDVLVNNAGYGLTKRIEDIAPEEWDDLFGVHVRAHFRLAARCAGALKSAAGAIVNVSSVAAKVGLPGRVAYGAAKSAVEGFTRTLAVEWAEAGVRVNGVAPGTIRTALVERNFECGLLDPDMVLARTPMRRFGTSAEVAAVIGFLGSPESSYVTGQTIYVDGGWTAWGG